MAVTLLDSGSGTSTDTGWIAEATASDAALRDARNRSVKIKCYCPA